MTKSGERGKRLVQIILKVLAAHGEVYPGALDDASELQNWLDEPDEPDDVARIGEHAGGATPNGGG